MNLGRLTKKEEELEKETFQSYHKSSVAWIICGGREKDSGTKFILIDETLPG